MKHKPASWTIFESFAALGTVGHWLDFQSQHDSANPIERLIVRVFANVSAMGCAVDCLGVEYWANMLREGENLRWHFDKDEVLWQKARQMKHPLISTVYYPAHCVCEGGELVIDHHSVTPAPDMLVAFAGHLRHCVRHVTKGVRWSVAMNFWGTVPEGVRQRLGEGTERFPEGQRG